MEVSLVFAKSLCFMTNLLFLFDFVDFTMDFGDYMSSCCWESFVRSVELILFKKKDLELQLLSLFGVIGAVKTWMFVKIVFEGWYSKGYVCLRVKELLKSANFSTILLLHLKFRFKWLDYTRGFFFVAISGFELFWTASSNFERDIYLYISLNLYLIAWASFDIIHYVWGLIPLKVRSGSKTPSNTNLEPSTLTLTY